jgi:hypothetical protein
VYFPVFFDAVLIFFFFQRSAEGPVPFSISFRYYEIFIAADIGAPEQFVLCNLQ